LKYVRKADTLFILYSFFFIIYSFSGGTYKAVIVKYFFIATALYAPGSFLVFETFTYHLVSTPDRRKNPGSIWVVLIKMLTYFIGGNLSEERLSPEPLSKDF
jgi:hypothetical protein